MQIEIFESTYQQLVAHAASLGMPPSAVPGLADATLSESIAQSPKHGGSPEGLVERFSVYRGALRGVTLEKLLANLRADRVYGH